MNLTKITAAAVDIAKQELQKAANNTNKISSNISGVISCENKLMGELDSIASRTKTSITHSGKNLVLPEFLYHFTPKSCWESIKKDGKIKLSTWETAENGMPGIFMVDRNNFLTQWCNKDKAKDINSLFGLPENEKGLDLGDMLLVFASKGEEFVALKIPTKKLDKSKIKFRPYTEVVKESFANFDMGKAPYDCDLIKEGLSLDKLKDYIKNEPIEYIYQDEICIDSIQDVSMFKKHLYKTAKEIGDKMLSE